MHILVVESTTEKIKKNKWKLRRLGFRKETPKRYVSHAKTTWHVNKARRFCERKGLKFHIKNSYGERSGDYRKVFFQNFRPNASRNKWYCSYCGKKLKSKKLVVDHLYPIYQVSKSLKLQKKLRNKGIHNVNDAKNLIPSRSPCNAKKSADMGLWILRGKIGKYGLIWKIRHALRNCIILYCLYFLVSKGIAKECYLFLEGFMWTHFNYTFPTWVQLFGGLL